MPAAEGNVELPVISVVVSTFNRAHLLSRLVDALGAQDLELPFETVIVDNGSSDGSSAVLERLMAASTIDLRVLRIEENHGPAPARNLGWQKARASLIAFTDDDCVPEPGWLSGLVGALTGADLVQGKTIANPSQRNVGMFAWAPSATSELGFYETCNMGYQRTVLESLDGFDESFHRSSDGKGGGLAVWGDDMDLALRAKDRGARSSFAPEAVVLHDVKPGGLRDRLADIPRRRGVVLVVKRYPEQRDRFESRWFVARAHSYLLAAAGGALVVAVRPRSVGGWLLMGVMLRKWAYIRGARYRRREWPRVLPQWFLVDATEIVMFAQASVKHRTAFL